MGRKRTNPDFDMHLCYRCTLALGHGPNCAIPMTVRNGQIMRRKWEGCCSAVRSSHFSMWIIKIETSKPKWNFKTSNKLLSYQPFMCLFQVDLRSSPWGQWCCQEILMNYELRGSFARLHPSFGMRVAQTGDLEPRKKCADACCQRASSNLESTQIGLEIHIYYQTKHD